MAGPASFDPSSAREQPVRLPNAPIRRVNDILSVQPPLSRRGHGPGILLILSHNVPLTQGDKPLDPEPVQKWAEEGFCVAFVTGLESDLALESVLTEAANALMDLGDILDTKDKFGVIVYDANLIDKVSRAVSKDPRYLCLIAYASSVPSLSSSKPTLLHSCDGAIPLTSDTLVRYIYPGPSPLFVLPNAVDYDPGSAALAHSRSLVFLRTHLGGPYFDIEAIWEEHTYFEFEERSVAKTMGTMVAEPYVNHVPTMTGGVGRENLTRFYRDHFIFSNPADARLQVVSRTVGPDRVVDEFVYHITHDRTVDWLLPCVPPTGKKLAIPMVAVVNIRGDRLYNEHIWWDQATALRQAGILPTHVPYTTPEGDGGMLLRLPVAGAEAADMLVDESKGKSNEMLGEGWGLRQVGLSQS